VKSDWGGVVLFPSFTVYPNTPNNFSCGNTGYTGFSGGGIAHSPTTGDVFFADYCRRRLGRLTKL